LGDDVADEFLIAINPQFDGVDWFLEEGREGCGEDVVSGWWHVGLAFVEVGSFITELGVALGWGVSGGMSNGAAMHPSLMKMSEYDVDDTDDYLFAVITLTL